MIIDKEIEIIVKSSRTISKLREIEILSNIGDFIKIPIERLWKSSNIKINVKCDICENIKYINFSMYNKNIKNYNIYTCSNRCAVFKNKKTCLERYGDENYNNIQKRLDNNLIRFGVDNPMKLEKIKVKVKETKFERYGDKNYNNRNLSDNTKLKRHGDKNYNNRNNYKITMFEKYGKHYSKTDEYKDKVKNTCLERYGVDSLNKSDIIKRKKVLSMLDKYGFISNSMTTESKNKLKKTNLERYNVEYPMQVLEFLEKQQKNSKKIKYYNDSLYYQSSYEKDFLDYCFYINLLNDISRGPTIRYVKDGKQKVHYPDFYIEKYNLIIEIKSDYYYYKYIETNKIKLKTAIDIGYNYLFIINKKYDLFDEIIDNFK